MKRLILLVGVPGSGKTTLAQNLVSKGFDRLCADDIRLELYGDAAQQGDPKRVFAIFFERFETLLKEGKNIVVDNMNVKLEHRQQITAMARNSNYTNIQIWVLDVPLDICLARNRKRERQVPEDVITNSFNTLNRQGKPKTEEGEIVIVKADESGQWQFTFPQ